MSLAPTRATRGCQERYSPIGTSLSLRTFYAFILLITYQQYFIPVHWFVSVGPVHASVRGNLSREIVGSSFLSVFTRG